LLKLIQVKIQEHSSCRKKNSKTARLDQSNVSFDQSKHKFCTF